jgi:hypothetical protein
MFLIVETDTYDYKKQSKLQLGMQQDINQDTPSAYGMLVIVLLHANQALDAIEK